MTPPRDEDATSDSFAQVIRLHRHPHDVDTGEAGGTSEPDSRGIWDHDAPITGLPERPSVWEQPKATEQLLAPADADATDASGRETTIVISARKASFPRLARRQAALAGAAAVLAATTLVVVLAGGSGHPRATHVASHAPTGVLKHAVADTTATRTEPRTHAHRTTTRTAAHSRPLTDHSSKRRVPQTATKVTKRQPSSVVPASASHSAAPSLQPTTPVQPAQAPAHSTNTLASSNASPCVPGELGC